MQLNGNTRKTLEWTRDIGLASQRPAYATEQGVAFHADSIEVLQRMKASCVDLVFTSPPFALTRKKEYGNESIEKYLSWFLPFADEIRRVLKPDGSFVLDLGGAWLPGVPVRSMYHFEVAVHLAKNGFRLAQGVLKAYSASMRALIAQIYKARIRPSGRSISEMCGLGNGVTTCGRRRKST